MIAITGANGQLGYATIQFLLQTTPPAEIVALVRDPLKVKVLTDKGITARIADYDDPASLNEGLKGIDKLLQISAASMDGTATRQEQAVVDAAMQQGVKHIVYTSTLSPSPEAKFLAAQTCYQTEQSIINSGITYTIFRNSMYLETIPQFIGSAMEDGQIFFPSGDGRISFVARTDIAAGLAHVLVEEGHENKIYAITGTASGSFADVALLLRERGLAEATHHDIPAEAYREELLKLEMPLPVADFYLSMADSIKAGEFSHTGNTLQHLLGRPLLSLQEFMKHA